MPYELFLALRYLRSRRKRRLARATSVAAILGIAMGVAALIVAFALSNGFRDEMRTKILEGTAHLSVVRADGRPIENYAELAGRLRQVKGVVSASATTYDGALARGTKGSGYAVIRGVEKDVAQSGWVRKVRLVRFLNLRKFRTQLLAQISRRALASRSVMFSRCSPRMNRPHVVCASPVCFGPGFLNTTRRGSMSAWKRPERITRRR